jgi:signal transduction histidine kinase
MKSIFKTACLTIFISLSCSVNLIAQKNNIKFWRITPDQGLSQSGVNCILQDSQRFMWFGTGDGLNRYNGVWNAEGVSIKIITPSPFWQIWWFRILAAKFLLGLIFIAYRKRVEYIEAQKKKLEIQVAEKTKEIANKNRQLKSALHELKEVQSQLVQAQKMASLSNLAAGIVHEINNPVGAIKSAANTSSRSLSKVIMTLEESRDLKGVKEDKNFMKALNILKSNNSITKMATERITKIIQSLKNFARLDEPEFQEADVHEGLESALILLHHEMKNRIKVVKKLGDVSKIYCYPIQLNQVFMNVLANAVQAIENKGTITIRTSKSDSKIIISISDNGIGIKKENLKKIFDPGFTTKGVGGGAGLGLSISYNIIKTHKGEIKVNSEEGKGTEVIITLPIKQEGVPT